MEVLTISQKMLIKENKEPSGPDALSASSPKQEPLISFSEKGLEISTILAVTPCIVPRDVPRLAMINLQAKKNILEVVMDNPFDSNSS